MAQNIEKYMSLNELYNKAENGLEKYKDEKEGTRYISSSFIALFLLSGKKSNSLSNLEKRSRSQNHLICISIIYHLEKCQLCIKVLRRRKFKTLKNDIY